MVDHLKCQLALRSHLMTVADLPTDKAWENVHFEPTTGQPFLEEEYVPATQTLRGLTPGGVVEDTGIYVIRWYGIQNTGISAIRNGVQSILTAFRPGLSISASDGAVIRIRGNPAPFTSQLRNTDAGRAVVTISIPFRVYTHNPA